MNPASTIFNTSPPPKHLVAIHGWGFNSAVWDDMGLQLEQAGHGLTAVNLPGFGGRPMLAGEYTLTALADSVVQAVQVSGGNDYPDAGMHSHAGAWERATMSPAPCIFMGWSLGGLVALEVAHRYPERVRALVLVAAAPRFTNTENWPHGVAPAVLDAFSETLVDDHRAALTRFLILQAGRTDLGRATVKKLKPLLFRHGTPNRDALAQGLVLLRETDYREVLPTIRCPVLFILGSRDNLLSSTVAEDLRGLAPECRTAVIEGSAHAPFISHPVEFFQVLMPFLEQEYF
ncbi:MAG: alpha/beta fold hydrolase [Gammaproteobacteria bacterium]|nr:alpha/beta fold hydrolase [Gammaproteobacteria bacterium]